jgi:hypothetical protein
MPREQIEVLDGEIVQEELIVPPQVARALDYATEHLIPVSRVYAMSDDNIVAFCDQMGRHWGDTPPPGNVPISTELMEALYVLHLEIGKRDLWGRVFTNRARRNA